MKNMMMVTMILALCACDNIDTTDPVENTPALTMESCMAQPELNDASFEYQFDGAGQMLFCQRTCTLGCRQVVEHTSWTGAGCGTDWQFVSEGPVECLPPVLTMDECLADPSHTDVYGADWGSAADPAFCTHSCTSRNRAVTYWAVYPEGHAIPAVYSRDCRALPGEAWYFVSEGPSGSQ